MNVVQPFSGCSQLFSSHQLHSRIGIVRRGDCMFIDKARQLELSQAIGGIVIDHNTSLKSSNGAIFSMTGDGFNNIHIPLVLMFKDEAFHLLHLLSKYPNLIVYIGEEKFFKETFYQKIEILESFIEPFNQTSKKWFYGERNIFEKKLFCPILSKKLKEFELAFQQTELENLNKQPIIQFEHVIEADDNKSVEEITSQLFASLNLTAINFGGQLNNIEAYRLALDKMVRTALISANQTISSNLSNTKQEQIEIPVEIITSSQEQTSTTATDTREYTEKRSETKTKD